MWNFCCRVAAYLNLPFETGLRQQASPLASAAHCDR